MKLQDLGLGLGFRVNESNDDKTRTEISKKRTRTSCFLSKAIAKKIAHSGTARRYFKHMIDTT